MTSRRRFIQTLAALPPAFAFRHARAANPAADPSRLALIIGNSAYHDAPLVNPANDAKAVGGLFTQAGFTVDSHLNAKRADMMAAIEKFGAAAKRSETKLVVFYYAGHGAQLDWRNYLLPVDAVVQRQEDMKQRCVDLNLLLGQLSAAKDKTFIIILDACRNNPFGASYRPEQKGLSQFDAPVGSLLAYATSPGNVASDGEGANGLYTENLVRELGQRNTRIEDALKRVRLNVRLASKGEQIPWETTSLEGDVFIFNEGQKKLTEAEMEKLLEADVTEWSRIKNSKKVDDWVGYLRTFPNGRFAEIAQMRLARLLADVERQRVEQQQQESARAEKLAAEKRQEEQKRLEQERAERERLRLAEAQRLAAERKRLEEQQAIGARRREDEQKALEAKRRQEQERIDQERQRIAAAEREAAEQKRQEEARLAEEQKRREQEKSVAVAKPAASGIAVTPGDFLINIGEGLPVPQMMAPSDNPFSAGRYPLGRVYTLGDTSVTRLSDILTGVEERIITGRVTKIDYDEDRVEYNNGMIITDLMGNALKIGEVVYETPVQLSPAEFQVGKKWTAAFRLTRNGKVSNAYYDLQIVKRENITVPAGTFDTFRIEGDGWNITFSERLEVKLWLVPGLNFAIKIEQLFRNRFGRFSRTERRELVALKQHTTETKCALPGSGLKRTMTIKSGCA